MTIKQFLGNPDKVKVLPKQSLKNCYAGTDTKITWIQLPQVVDGQDYLVMSATLAANFAKDQKILAKAQVKLTEEGWGLVMPASCVDLGEIEL